MWIPNNNGVGKCNKPWISAWEFGSQMLKILLKVTFPLCYCILSSRPCGIEEVIINLQNIKVRPCFVFLYY